MNIKRLHLGLGATLTVMILSACGGTTDQEMTGTGAGTATAEAKTSSIDITASKVMWKGTMIGVYSHEGTLNFKQGEISTEGDKIKGGSFTIDMTTMTPTDENYNAEEGKTPEKLVGHLSSPEFFDVASHPTANFVIKAHDGNKITGDLTLKGVTNEETVEQVTYDGATKIWSGVININRKSYGVSWDSPMKEMVLSDAVELKVNLVL